jgi:hypothetical protein
MITIAGLAFLGASAPLLGGEGKGHISELNLGEYWFGTKVEKEDLIGKVVLFEVWGS